MKDYIDYDEEVVVEGDEDEENVLNPEDDEFYNMKRTNNKNKTLKKKKFDESVFDVKVAKSIVAIHYKVKRSDGFSKWVDKNLFHLQKLYSLSNLSCTPEEFYTYIYENSNKK
jgi:hypothetical protein